MLRVQEGAGADELFFAQFAEDAETLKELLRAKLA